LMQLDGEAAPAGLSWGPQPTANPSDAIFARCQQIVRNPVPPVLKRRFDGSSMQYEHASLLARTLPAFRR
jgi:hypothetical protein